MSLTEDQIIRYSRQIFLSEIGTGGQEKIRHSRVLVVGAGGLGSPAAYYLAAAGVGVLGIADFDCVDLSNLGRQILHFTDDLGRQKTDSALEKLMALNPDVKVQSHPVQLDAANAASLVAAYDFVVEATDNFESKFLINDACVSARVAFSHGGVLRLAGQTMTVLPGQSACYRCVFGAPPPPEAVPACSQAGILGSVAGILGAIQATECLKYIAGVSTLLTNTLLTFNATDFEFRKIVLKPNPRCAACGLLTSEPHSPREEKRGSCNE